MILKFKLAKKDLLWLIELLHEEGLKQYSDVIKFIHPDNCNKLIGKILDLYIPFRRCKTAYMCECISRGWNKRWGSNRWKIHYEEYSFVWYNR